MRSLTCDKLSHCLFDFDCVDLNLYERETYHYQEFILENLRNGKSNESTEVSHDSKEFELLKIKVILCR